MPQTSRPIVYVRGYAGTQADIEEAVDDPFYGFNLGSTHVRAGVDGSAQLYVFPSPLIRLMRDYGYRDVFDGENERITTDVPDPKKTIRIHRYYDVASQTLDQRGKGQTLTIEQAASDLYDLVEAIQAQARAEKVILIAHSMGGLTCRCVIQKIYPETGVRASERSRRAAEYIEMESSACAMPSPPPVGRLRAREDV